MVRGTYSADSPALLTHVTAYCGVVRYLMTKNPHFRILALTATPGSKSEAVQSVIDNLHVRTTAALSQPAIRFNAQIGHIEIRSEESLDLRQYLHKKDVVEKIVPVTGDLASLRDGLVEIMKPMVKRCYDAQLIYVSDPAKLKPFALQLAIKKIGSNKWAYPVLNKLRVLAQAMLYLLEQSSTSCIDQLRGAISNKGNKDDGPLQRLVDQAVVLSRRPGYVSHPKMDALRSLLIEHFSSDETSDTRIMVFCSFRAVVEELVALLNEQSPLIRATRFVGQGTDKDGVKGFGQKQQQEVCWPRRLHEIGSRCEHRSSIASVAATSIPWWQHRLAKRVSTLARST
jgi:ATP-dependent DNA helicase MPH1